MPAGGSLAARAVGRDTGSGGDAVYSRICTRPRAKGRYWIRMSSHPPAVPPRLLSGRVAFRVRAAAAPFSQSEGCACTAGYRPWVCLLRKRTAAPTRAR
ncbi:hypothetical protein MTO96_009768 [Rhipicephalus appendiculatus]